MRAKAKKYIKNLIHQNNEANNQMHDEDSEEEEIITETEEETKEETKENDSVIPKHEDVLQHANFIDRLVELRENIKKDPKSFELIK